jgi:acetyltransferase-like isoleucine patch superfamily enzyme
MKVIENTGVGDGTTIEKFVSIEDSNIGSDCHIWRFVNIYGADIGDNCMIGTFVEIQKDVVIGKRSRIQSHSFVCSLVTIGNDVFVGHGVKFINDRHPPSDRENWEVTTVGDNVVIGSNATILPVSIGDGAKIGAGSVVVDDVPANTVVAGNPAKVVNN